MHKKKSAPSHLKGGSSLLINGIAVADSAKSNKIMSLGGRQYYIYIHTYKYVCLCVCVCVHIVGRQVLTTCACMYVVIRARNRSEISARLISKVSN